MLIVTAVGRLYVCDDRIELARDGPVSDERAHHRLLVRMVSSHVPRYQHQQPVFHFSYRYYYFNALSFQPYNSCRLYCLRMNTVVAPRVNVQSRPPTVTPSVLNHAHPGTGQPAQTRACVGTMEVFEIFHSCASFLRFPR